MRFCTIAFGIAMAITLHAPVQADILFPPGTVEAIRNALQADPQDNRQLREALQQAADNWLTQGPWSVMDHPSPAVSGNPHDYFSEGPYWWPDPDNPGAPYIRRDGEVNPERFVDHHQDINRLFQSVTILSLAAYTLDEPRYAQHAAGLLRVWCVDPETRMNPHLEYAQAIRGRTDGRGIGIIDIRRQVELMQGLVFLDRTGLWPPEERDAVREWFSELLHWLTTSPKGLDEKNHYNNHAVWWCAQVAALAHYLDRPEILQDVWNHTRDVMIPSQITEEGAMPHELKRTRSMSYTIMNLNGFACIARMARLDGTDIWNHRAFGTTGLQSAIGFVVPHMRDFSGWEHEQIRPWVPRQQAFLLLSAVDCEREEWLNEFDELPPGDDAMAFLMQAYRLTLP